MSDAAIPDNAKRFGDWCLVLRPNTKPIVEIKREGIQQNPAPSNPSNPTDIGNMTLLNTPIRPNANDAIASPLCL